MINPGMDLVDSCVLIDILAPNPWTTWSERMLLDWGGDLVVNAVILSEVALGFTAWEDLLVALPPDKYRRDELDDRMAFLAGQAHRAYRQRGGTRERTLPNFLIGAHAALAGMTLITRDPKRYRQHYPHLALIAPDTHHGHLVPGP